MKNLNDLKEGEFYNVVFGNGVSNFSYNNTKPALKFNKSFPCYDARFHGVGNPDDYVCFEFQLPEKFGVWRAYRFQILSIELVDKEAKSNAAHDELTLRMEQGI